MSRPRVYDELAEHDLPNLLAAIGKLAEVREWSMHEALWAVVTATLHRAAEAEA